MRKMTTLAALAMLTLGTAAYAQAQDAQPPAAPGDTTAPAPAPAIKNVTIVDITELPPDTQAKVNEAVSKAGEHDLQTLRDSIDATPEVASALKEQGLTSQAVILASMDNAGTLSLVTKKKG